jgi:hypothetical protein
MKRLGLCNDIRTHWLSALLFLAYWLAAWILDAAIAIARRGEVGGSRAPVVFALTCLVSPLLAAALAAWWRAPEGARYSFGAAALTGAVICEANLVVIFCVDAGVSTLTTGGSKVAFDVLMGVLTVAVIGGALGLLAALLVWLFRTLALLRTPPGEGLFG